MNILTFDIEDWYNCDFISEDKDWSKHEVRIYDSVEKILIELEHRNLKGTFFCLGWIAKNHPEVIRSIYKAGHHIGCHSYQHDLAYKFTRHEFKNDTYYAKSLIEDVIGDEVNAFRAPGFSITSSNLWAFEVLSELGFFYDSSVFPSTHDYGGYPEYGKAEPAQIILSTDAIIKEFPINTHKVFNKELVFSGGGYFRLFPYTIIKSWAKQSPYVMTYFHPRDFDVEQPVIQTLPLIRKFKSYYGLEKSFNKFQRLIQDFNFVNIEQADKSIDWSKTSFFAINDPKAVSL